MIVNERSISKTLAQCIPTENEVFTVTYLTLFIFDFCGLRVVDHSIPS